MNLLKEMHHAEDEDAAVDLSMDEVAIIFSFFSYVDIMRSRRVCTTWRDAAKKTIVPMTNFRVNSNRTYNAMRVMSTALPNLQQITLDSLDRFDRRHKYSDGDEPDEALTQTTAHWPAHDIINIISRFTTLRNLTVRTSASLNGRYPALFNFECLQQLTIHNCPYLKFDLEILSGTPQLKELDLFGSPSSSVRNVGSRQTGNLSALRVMKDTIEMVRISDCRNIRGNFMDLANFPCLKKLYIHRTDVAGDIRDISRHDFPALQYLHLPDTVRGGSDYKFQNIAEVPSFMHAIHRMLKRSPNLFIKDLSSYLLFSYAFHWTLSKDSPDWYVAARDCPRPPFRLQIIRAGSRLGWSWYSNGSRGVESCEINWLDPEPSSESADYEPYMVTLHRIQQGVNFYWGYHEPPNELEYRRLCEQERL